MLNKTLIEQLNNCYIDCSYSKSDNTIIVNIENPNPNGDDVREPFTIRTKDGYTLKYDEVTGDVVFRINKKYLPTSTSEEEVIRDYDLYFDDYNFDLQTLSTYENIDPVVQFKTPTYAQTEGDNSIEVPRFEYEDIEKQKENIFLIDTGIKNRYDKTVFVASYYGKDPNRCKLELLVEVKPDPFDEDPSYIIKTGTGRMFYFLVQHIIYGSDPFGGTGKEVANIDSISSNAEQTGGIIEEDNTKGLFSTYVVNQTELNNISNTGAIYSEIIINTFSYPIKFNDDDLLEVNIKLGNTPLEDIKGKKFKRAEPKIKIFTFSVPYLKDVETCKLLLPFNTEIILDYDVIRGKTINGYIQYEVSTNSSTLYIDNEDVTFFKDIVVIETVVPYKPTGEYVGFKESQKRLGKQTPVLLIKCLQEEQQQHFIKGFINYQITGILENELKLLNEELQKGVITNE